MYNELIYHLDLCTLAYQLHGQTFAWPMDPFYEQLSTYSTSRRDNFMKEVRDEFKEKAKGLDPIRYQFNRLLPWQPCIIRPENSWIMYNTPAYIHDRIRRVWLSGSDSTIKEMPGRSAEHLGTDDLYCFTGCTGIHATQKQESLMGFVLVRQHTGTGRGYDVHITFRGSRSGSAARAVMQGLFNGDGNPDWVTDTDNYYITDNRLISDYGKVCVGFMKSVALMVEKIYNILIAINERRGNTPPANIYVAGHSLGGALATHFTSSVLVGNKYGINTTPENGPLVLRNWPWDRIKLFTYGAPTTGDKEYISRLNSKARIFRVRIVADPITQYAINEHAGSEIAIIGPTGAKAPDGTYHEPYLIRRELLTVLNEWKEPMDNIPGRQAPHVKQHIYHKQNDRWTRDEPWTVWEDFTSLHREITSIWGTTFTLADIFSTSGSFLHNVHQYLAILKKTYSHRSTYKMAFTKSNMKLHQDAIESLMTIVFHMYCNTVHIEGVTVHAPLPTIDEIYTAWRTAAKVIDPPKKLKGSNPPSKNLGVCLILAAMATGIPAVVTTLENPIYKKLYACINTEN